MNRTWLLLVPLLITLIAAYTSLTAAEGQQTDATVVFGVS